MLALALLITALKAALGSPIASPDVTHDVSIPLTIFGRQLTDCTRHRTIWKILWSCFSTIFACTWVAVHPNVPNPHDSGCKKLSQKVLIFVYAVLAPECMTMWALRQRMGAAKHANDYNDKFHPGVKLPDRSVLWKVKAWFRNHENEKPDVLWSLTHGFLLEMHGLVHDSGSAIEDVQEIPQRLGIPEEEIDDKSKGDLLSKFLVVLQMTWFIVECIARWTTRLHVTELEVVTLAYAFLNIVTYALWWNKPQNMRIALRAGRYKALEGPPEKGGTTGQDVLEGTLSEDEGETRHIPKPGSVKPQFMASLAGAFASLHPRTIRLDKIFDFILAPMDPVLEMLSNNDAENSRVFYSSWNAVEERKTALFFCMISLVFGGLHLIPIWTSLFPSPFEGSLWKWSAIGMTAEPLIWFGIRAFGDLNFERMEIGTLSRVGIFVFVGLVGSVWAAAVVRLIIIVVAFTTLRDLPPTAYEMVEWTKFIPHFGSGMT